MSTFVTNKFYYKSGVFFFIKLLRVTKVESLNKRSSSSLSITDDDLLLDVGVANWDWTGVFFEQVGFFSIWGSALIFLYDSCG